MTTLTIMHRMIELHPMSTAQVNVSGMMQHGSMPWNNSQHAALMRMPPSTCGQRTIKKKTDMGKLYHPHLSHPVLPTGGWIHAAPLIKNQSEGHEVKGKESQEEECTQNLFAPCIAA